MEDFYQGSILVCATSAKPRIGLLHLLGLVQDQKDEKDQRSKVYGK